MMDAFSPVTDILHIELHQSGSVMVSGSIKNKQHALNLLEAARDAVIKYHEKDKPIIVPNAL